MTHLSIIIPMYNVEPYVERCIRSIEDQDIPKNEYEIICINDGSPDNSREVVVKMQNEFGNIILIDQENHGVSIARNNGIDVSKGRYILFIDPDDYVAANSLKRILRTADENNAEVLFLGYTFLNEDGTIRAHVLYKNYQAQVFDGPEAYFISRGDGRIDPDRMVAVLFKKEFINLNNLRYLSDVPFLEDGEFIARILCLSKKCSFDGESFYLRTTRPGSATNSKLYFSEKATKGFIRSAINLNMFKQDKDLDVLQKDFLNQPICKFVVLVIDSLRKPLSLIRIRDAKRELENSGLRKIHLKSVNSEFTQLGFIYNRSAYLLLLYMFVLNCLRYFYLRLNKLFPN